MRFVKTNQQLTFIVALVPFMPLAMIWPSRTNTHPTGVSSDLRASSAYAHQIRY